jgi:glycosyltransferase involved in cell wall biosynthesis
VIHNGVPVPADVPPPPPDDAPFTIGTVARLDRFKGVDVLIRAAAILGDDVRVEVIGDGDQRDALRRIADEVGMGDRLALRGWRHEAMAEVARTCHVFALPSRLEAFPLTVLEAMAWGVPVVATDVGSTSEAVEDGVTGGLVPPDDVGALAAAMQALRDPGLRARRAAAARARVAEDFTATAMAQRYEALYREVSGRRRRR